MARRSAIAAPTASASPSTPAPDSSRPGSRSSTSPRGWQPLEPAPAGSVLVYNGEVYNHPELRAELAAHGSRVPHAPATPRSSCAARARGPRRRSTASTASSRSPGGSRAARRLTLVRDRFGVRPLTTRCSATAPSSSAPRRRRCSPPARSRAAADLAGHRRGLHALGPAGAADGVRRASASSSPAACVVWERGRIVERAHAGGRPSHRRRGAGRRGARASCCATASRLRLRADVPVGDLPLRRPRLEPDHRPRPGGDRPRAADLLDRLRRSRLRRARPPGAEVARAIGTRHHVVEAGAARDRRRVPGGRPPRRDAAGAHRAGAALPARPRGPRARITVVATGEGADELFWGYDLFKEVVLRELHRARAGAGRASCSTSSTPISAPAARGAGPAWARVPARDRARSTSSSAPT